MLGEKVAAKQAEPRRYLTHGAKDMCVRCYSHVRYYDERRPPNPRQQRPRAHVLEDWEWLDHDPFVSGTERIRQAAPRLGMTVRALQKALERAGVKP